MKVIGITGQVGSGKSQVLDFLAEKYNCRIIKTDEVAGRLRDEAGPCHDAVCDIIGAECINTDGSINKAKMAEVIFKDKQILEKVNDILHPAVKREVLSIVEAERISEKADYVFVESALLLDDGYDTVCDEIWYIFVRDEVRVQRLAKSRGYSDEKVRDILKQQLSDEQMRDGCKWVIDNSDEFSLTAEQIEMIL